MQKAIQILLNAEAAATTFHLKVNLDSDTREMIRVIKLSKLTVEVLAEAGI